MASVVRAGRHRDDPDDAALRRLRPRRPGAVGRAPGVKLFAISDLHLGFEANRAALATLRDHRDDWVALVGDVGETAEHLETAFRAFCPRFARVIWVPGNHELWTMNNEPPEMRGEAKYRHLVSVCERYGVITPEDAFPVWPGKGPPTVIVPLFTLYDYSFRPDDVPRDRAIAWAMETNVLCSDEAVLHPDPYPTRDAWCHARCDAAEARLEALPADHATVLLNHFPMRRADVLLRWIPRFSLWCGTRRTEDWHTRFRARAVVTGHLHVRTSRVDHGVRFEEVSVGYPRQWDPATGMESRLREILAE